MKRIYSIIIFIFSSIILLSQDLQKADFHPPLKGQLYLSGAFAELRTNHFHSGIDIKTGGVVGKAVYSVHDGYVSRVAVSPTGFGKVLYITHNNGYTTVYAHLEKFIPEIDKYVKDYQYKNKKIKVNIYLEKDKFKVKKGQLIAYSGNSGSSGGPHVHFEVRKTENQKPVNPLLFDFPVKDWTRPKINSLKVFPVTKNDYVNGENKVYTQQTAGWGEEYRLQKNEVIKIHGQVYFGINTYDAMNDVKNKNGIYSIDCLLDDERIWYYEADEFFFHETRNINSLLDYKTVVAHKAKYYSTNKAVNINVGMLKYVKDDGIILLNDDIVHTVKFVVKDTYKNTSILTFKIQKDDKLYPFVAQESFDYVFKYNEDNFVKTDVLRLSAKANTLFEDISFNIEEVQANEPEALSPIYMVGERYMTSFKPFEIAIKIDETIADKYIEKLYIGELSAKNEWEFCGGTVEAGWINFNTYNLGKYKIMVDTVPPQIQCLNLSTAIVNEITEENKIKFKLNDEQSEITEIKPSLNGEWLLMDWDPKTKTLSYEIDERLKKGLNELKLTVYDALKNANQVTLKLRR